MLEQRKHFEVISLHRQGLCRAILSGDAGAGSTVNGKKVAEGAIDHTVPGSFSLSETFDVGVDNGTPVSNNYNKKDHFPFTGQIDTVTITLLPEGTAK